MLPEFRKVNSRRNSERNRNRRRDKRNQQRSRNGVRNPVVGQTERLGAIRKKFRRNGFRAVRENAKQNPRHPADGNRNRKNEKTERIRPSVF